MMRRARAGFAWVSMMDLLFGLFGGMLVLTVLIAAKLGKESDIDEKPFHLVTMSVSSQDERVRKALGRMHLGFELEDGITCTLGAAAGDECGNRGASVKFATTAGPPLMATLFIGTTEAGSKEIRARVTPTLRDVAVLRDVAGLDDAAKISVRIAAKSAKTVWEPGMFELSVGAIVQAALAGDHSDVPLLGVGGFSGGCEPAAQPSCKPLGVENGVLVFNP